MAIWEYTADVDHYYNIELVDHQRDGPFFHRDELRTGKPLTTPLPSIRVRYDTDWTGFSPSQRALARKNELPRGDFPSLYGIEVIMRDRALRVLEPLIHDSVQIIALECEEDQLFLIHVIDVVDVLDYGRSEFDRLENGVILRVLHYELKNLELLEGKGIFRMAGLPTEFVTDDFKALVEEHDLKGLVWKPLP